MTEFAGPSDDCAFAELAKIPETPSSRMQNPCTNVDSDNVAKGFIRAGSLLESMPAATVLTGERYGSPLISGDCHRFVKRLGLERHAVMRRHHLPLARGFHPNIGQAIMVLIALAVGFALFVIAAGDDRDIAVEPDLQIGKFGNLHVDLGVRGVTDVSGLAVDIAILNS